MLKDHYRTLGINPGATTEEVRKSYRRLAMAYHPDRHAEDHASAAHFREIKEAYETLTDPVKKEAYLQMRWLAKSMGQDAGRSEPLTGFSILRDAISLERLAASLDPYRNGDAELMLHLRCILSDEAVGILQKEEDPAIVTGIAENLLKCGRILRLPEARELCDMLNRFLPRDHPTRSDMSRYLSARESQAAWERWKIPVFLTATLLICILIYITGR